MFQLNQMYTGEMYPIEKVVYSAKPFMNFGLTQRVNIAEGLNVLVEKVSTQQFISTNGYRFKDSPITTRNTKKYESDFHIPVFAYGFDKTLNTISMILGLVDAYTIALIGEQTPYNMFIANQYIKMICDEDMEAKVGQFMNHFKFPRLNNNEKNLILKDILNKIRQSTRRFENYRRMIREFQSNHALILPISNRESDFVMCMLMYMEEKYHVPTNTDMIEKLCSIYLSPLHISSFDLATTIIRQQMMICNNEMRKREKLVMDKDVSTEMLEESVNKIKSEANENKEEKKEEMEYPKDKKASIFSTPIADMAEQFGIGFQIDPNHKSENE